MKKGFVFILFFIYSINVFAEANGNAIEYSVSLNNLNVQDPNGSTKSITEFSPYNFAWVSKLSRGSRYRASIYYTEFTLAASTSNIGQEIKQLDFSVAYQNRFNISRSIHPYLGVGIAYSQFEAIARHNIDSAGFLTVSYADRKENIISLVLSADFDFEVNDVFDLGVKFTHREPLGDGIRDSSVGLAIIYKL